VPALVLIDGATVRASFPLARCALLGLAAVAAACGSKAPAITGLTVTVTMAGVAADQLEIKVTTPAGAALTPTRRPASAGGVLPSPQSVSIFLPDALAGSLATCTVTPLLDGQPASAAGFDSTMLVLHELVPLSIALNEARHDDGGSPDTPDAEVGDAADDTGTLDGGGSEVVNPGSKANGQTCTSSGECESTLCVDGVCCASACGALCEACNLPGKEGTCAPVPAGTATAECASQPASTCAFDGTCDGSGGCRRHPAGVACKVAACAGPTFTPASACDGQGRCVAASPVDCTPYLCDANAAACGSTCKMDTDCVTGRQCMNGSCGTRPKKDNGAGCVASTDCTSGHCVDGVCCATACTGACLACNQAGSLGMCLPVPVGKSDPHAVCKDGGVAACGRNGLCDGAGGCALYPAGVMCAAGTCRNATLVSPKRCDGQGACQTAADVDCTPYRCDPSTTACYTSCTLTLQCSMRHTCTGSACQ